MSEIAEIRLRFISVLSLSMLSRDKSQRFYGKTIFLRAKHNTLMEVEWNAFTKKFQYKNQIQLAEVLDGRLIVSSIMHCSFFPPFDWQKSQIQSYS